MRIVYLSCSVIPSRTANSIHVMKMCSAFAGLGHDVTLFAPDDPALERGVDDVYDYYGVENRFSIQKFSWARWTGRGYYYGYCAAVDVFKTKPDLVYGRYLPGCFFCARGTVPIVYEAHFPVSNHGRLCEWMFRKMIRKPAFKRFVVISGALRRYFETQYTFPNTTDIVVSHDAADPSANDDSPLQLDRSRLQVGYIGHLYAGRGIHIAGEMAARCPWADFHFIGGNESDIQRCKEKYKSNGNMFFHGFLPPSTAAVYRNAFDVLLAPYQRSVSIDGGGDTSQWMSPLKLFEYMAAGKAILCSRISVLQEVLTDRETAILCEPDDAESWIQNLHTLHDNEDAAATIREIRPRCISRQVYMGDPREASAA